MGLIFYPGWEWWDATRNGGTPPFPPGIPCGIGGMPTGSRLTFYMGNDLTFRMPQHTSSEVTVG